MSLGKKIFTGFAAIIAASTFAISGSAQTKEEKADTVQKTEKHDRRGMGRDGFGRGMRGLHGIELSDEQKKAIKAIHDANKPDEAVREEIKTIMQARRAGTITPEQTERAKQLRSQAKEKKDSVKAQIMNVLTAEQRQQIETRKVEIKKHREQREQNRQQTPAKTTTTEKPSN